jgi:rubrerythrin
MTSRAARPNSNLKDAFAGESQANRRYLYFAAKADVEGYNDVSTVFRSTAEGETGHAHGHLEYLAGLRRSGDRPADRFARPTT